MAGKFVLTKRDNGEFQFNLRAGNGQIILSSEGYSTHKAALAGIESVRRNSADDVRFDRKIASNGKPFFSLTATNGQIIGKSQLYASAATRDKGIASVKANAPTAALDDKTA